MEKNREYLWDNLKALLIFLVVIGHFADLYIESNVFKSIFICIYAFHMPLFIFVSGLFHNNRNIGNKIVAYIVIGYLYEFFIFMTKNLCGGEGKISILEESAIPWYMFAMAMFIGLTYILRNVNPKLVLLATFLLGLMAGYDKNIGDYLILARLFVFYPFYYLGTIVDRRKLEDFTSKKHIKFIGLFILVIWVILSFCDLDLVYVLRKFFTGRNPYAKIHAIEFGFEKGIFAETGAFMRVIHYLISIITSLACISLIPRVKLPVISKMGTRTLQIYFWHRIILHVFQEYGIIDELCSTREGKLVYLIIGVIMTFVLMSKIFSFPTDFIMRLTKKE